MLKNFWLGLLLILIVVGVAGYISWPTTTKIAGRNVTVRQGLDLQGGVRLVYSIDLSKTADADKSAAVESTRKVIEQRVNTTGVSEPVIQPSKIGDQQTIVIELPGYKNADDAKKLIGKTAQLQFKEQSSDGNDWVPTQLTGKQLKRATVQFDQNTNKPQINLEFNDEGAQLFADITGRNVGKPVAIYLDSDQLSAPTVQEKISGGQAQITGDFTVQYVRDTVNLLNAGALDVPINLIAENTIGATLGESSIKMSLVAGVIGLLLVALFMLINYRVAGIVAVLALAGYSLITLALFKLIPVTLTLSGIAGFILSIGMAVDANILIFERMREELKKGRDLIISLEDAFRRAWPSVRDSNMATIITCAILYFTTTGLVKGFALTLAIGVIVSLFSSITISRVLLRLFAKSTILRKGLAKI